MQESTKCKRFEVKTKKLVRLFVTARSSKAVFPLGLCSIVSVHDNDLIKLSNYEHWS